MIDLVKIDFELHLPMYDINIAEKDHAFESAKVYYRGLFMSETETHVLDGQTFIVKDKRQLGFYCIYCQRFSKDVEMDERGLGLTPNQKKDGSTLIFKKDPDSLMPKTKEVWRVFLHYDGCRGWD
jgi:hypothetical protein